MRAASNRSHEGGHQQQRFPVRGGGRSLIASPLSIASCLLPLPDRGHGSLRGRKDIRRNIWFEAQALQCPQRAHVAVTRPNGLPRSQLAPSPRRATITSETRPGWILLKRGSGGRGLLGPAERLP
jgi:hypothetical protein